LATGVNYLYSLGVPSVYSSRVVRLTRLRKWRERKAFSQQELAERAHITRAALSRIESGAAEPHPRTIRKLAQALGVQPEDLMRIEDFE
jgi:transcriptional regulator with XRE-family HTH domain